MQVHVIRTIRLAGLFALGILPMGAYGQTQEVPLQPDPEFAKLAARIAEPLRKAKAKKVIVVDLRAPGFQARPVGKWLADQLSAALQRDFPELEVLDRSSLTANANDDPSPKDQSVAFQKDMKRARSHGARVLISGTFARVPQGIGISLSSASLSNDRRLFVQAHGALPTSAQFATLFPEPIPVIESKDGFPKGGTGGLTSPECISCPIPDYSDAQRRARYEGVVVLEIVVTADGRTGNISVVSRPGTGLEENAVRAVRGWRFKPAVDLDEKPIAVVVPVEVTFRLR
jgi:TonB family protein